MSNIVTVELLHNYMKCIIRPQHLIRCCETPFSVGNLSYTISDKRFFSIKMWFGKRGSDNSVIFCVRFTNQLSLEQYVHTLPIDSNVLCNTDLPSWLFSICQEHNADPSFINTNNVVSIKPITDVTIKSICDTLEKVLKNRMFQHITGIVDDVIIKNTYSAKANIGTVSLKNKKETQNPYEMSMVLSITCNNELCVEVSTVYYKGCETTSTRYTDVVGLINQSFIATIIRQMTNDSNTKTINDYLRDHPIKNPLLKQVV